MEKHEKYLFKIKTRSEKYVIHYITLRYVTYECDIILLSSIQITSWLQMCDIISTSAYHKIKHVNVEITVFSVA